MVSKFVHAACSLTIVGLAMVYVVEANIFCGFWKGCVPVDFPFQNDCKSTEKPEKRKCTERGTSYMLDYRCCPIEGITKVCQ